MASRTTVIIGVSVRCFSFSLYTKTPKYSIKNRSTQKLYFTDKQDGVTMFYDIALTIVLLLFFAVFLIIATHKDKNGVYNCRIFLSGIMMGNSENVQNQSYRHIIKKILQSRYGNLVSIDDPYEDFIDPNDKNKLSPFYYDYLLSRVASSDILISFIPNASMGSAVELYHAHLNKVPAYVISPLHHIVFNSCTQHQYYTFQDFINQLNNGELDQIIHQNATRK